MIDRANIAFPHFDLEHVVIPEFDPSNPNAPQLSTQQQQKAYYSTKEDQDVAVFMAVAKKLPLQSLLHLLQDHVRSQQEVPRPVTVKTEPVVVEMEAEKVHKHLRFATVTETTTSATSSSIVPAPVLCEIHEIESWKHLKQLWWNDTEMRWIRQSAIDTVLYFRKNRPDFIQSVQIVLDQQQQHQLAVVLQQQQQQQQQDNNQMDTDDTETKTTNNALSNPVLKNTPAVDAALQEIAKDSVHARGLETHICDRLSSLRKETVQAVLEEQVECQRCQDTLAIQQESLRGQSLAYSQSSQVWAWQLASCDHLEALKATLASWKETTNTNTSTEGQKKRPGDALH